MDYRKRNINSNCTILDALKQMDIIDKKLLIIIDNNKYLGLISAGDIQRAIIRNISLETIVSNVIRKKIIVGKPGDSFENIKLLMIKHRIELYPIVNEKNEIEKIYFWEELFGEKRSQTVKQLNVPVVIMAGGLGKRLKPLTNVLPKPLIPIGEKSIIEEIFKRFGNHGCHKFYISVNYKADLIEYYLRNQNLPYTLEFYKENKPMGTAGSLSLLKGKINQTFFVNNCDIIIDQDYSEILEYHRENKNEITIVSALKHYPIPYGTIETGNNGQLIKLKEKPEITFKINSGMYILEPNLINEIPESTFYHITQIIEKVKTRHGNVGVFPVSEKSWRDIGNWKEYYSNLCHNLNDDK